MRHDPVEPDVPPEDSILVAGCWRAAASGATLPVHAPDTGAVIGRIARGGAGEIDAAVAAARAAFEGAWGRAAPVERGRILARFATLIQANADALVASRPRTAASR